MEDWTLNAYQCGRGHFTVVEYRDAGTTPMYLVCKTEGCESMAQSQMGRIHPAMGKPTHIWRRALPAEMKRWRRKNPEMYRHCQMGGLVLEEIDKAPKR